MVTTPSQSRQMKLLERNTVLMVHDSVIKINRSYETWQLYLIIEHIFKFTNGRIFCSECSHLQNRVEVTELLA
jgi:hypothetical protein